MRDPLHARTENDLQKTSKLTRETRLPQRVVVLTHEFYPKQGGIATHVDQIATALVELGVQVTVWAPEPESGQRRDSADNSFNFEVRPLRLRGSRRWRSRLKLIWYLLSARDSWHDAVLYLPEPGPVFTWCYLQLIPGLLPSKLVIALHGSELEYLGLRSYRRILLHRLLRNADRVGVVSRFVKNSLLSRYPDIEEKLVLAYGAVRTNFLRLNESPSPDSAQIAHEKWIVLTVARIHPRKGHIAVIEALGLLPQPQRKKIIYRIAGPVWREAFRNDVAAKAAALGVEVEFTGALSEADLKTAYANADVFVMASVRSQSSIEGFGLVYLEAGAYGLPVVAHNIGGVSDAVKSGVTGILVPPDNRQALADAILRLFESPALCRAMGEAGRRHAQTFSWSHAARELFSGL